MVDRWLTEAALDFPYPTPILATIFSSRWECVSPAALFCRCSQQGWHDAHRNGITLMAKAANIKIKLLSSADTGYFYVTKKNARTKTDKLSFKKYDPVARKHV